MRIVLLIIFCLFFSSAVFAQKDKEILYSVDFKQASINEVVKDLEAKSNYHFYYDVLQLDSLRITVSANQLTITNLLNKVFEGTNINFAIHNKNIFLIKGKTIDLDLAQAYYVNKVGKEPVSVKKNDTSYLANEKIQYATTANKLYEIGIKTNDPKSGTALLSGIIREPTTEALVKGASISIENSEIKAISNQDGFYSLNVPLGKHTLFIKAPNKNDANRQIMVYGDGKLNIDLKERVLTLKEVQILANKLSVVKNLEMGVSRLDLKTIKKVPSLFGEPDVLRVVLTLPGVQTVGEASTGFNVRGGSTDQNLILLNDATIYNPSHFFGFFSAFNPDIVKDIQLYKSTIPEKFGGRLSSVLEVNNRDGNKKKITGTAGIGIITSRFSIEGPIDSNKTSFILGGRATYSNWLLKLLPDAYENSKASFYDFNLGINHQFDQNNELSVAGYYSKDNFKLNSDTSYNYSNKNASIKWKHIFNSKLNVSFNLGTDFYDYSIMSDINPVNAYNLKFKINQSNFKSDFNYTLSEKHSLRFGLSAIYYKLNPGEFKPIGSESLVIEDIVQQEQALESAIYLGDEFKVSDNFAINAGLRYSLYNYLGPNTINNYAANLPITEENQISQTSFGKNKPIKTYHGPEIRMSARYNFTDDFSIKAAYNTLRQYIHLLSNTTAISPTDIYKLSDPNIKPQFGNQVSLGLYKNYNSKAIETSIEVYYKKIKDYLDYKSGASLIMNHHIETDIVSTKGKAYGIEFFIKKNAGKLTGWMSYAYSRTMLKMDNELIGEPINRGEYYPANHDKPHAFNFTGNYAFKQRYSLSLNVTYSTGRPITLPIAKYYYAGSERVFYTDRNAYRIPDYFRTDLAFNIEGNHKIDQTFHNSFTLGLYNLTGRKNAYSTYFVKENGVITGYKLSIFANILPFISYNIKF
ncbi:TonB-dependent receptor [Pedobacter frigiditerrae]|uniref:TonB-dependent receptor n=1 Tax=Pedobacter frigiditerrae TaxID=2530452 RepID=A0A4R0MT23_9SPHI|nr:carboxypeptidase-like regulatory domain-containing protein [Pedobacter frigiditerrae]TCC90160.1 TonB-dependent receptor [Pedobacter frigiditerrae]